MAPQQPLKKILKNLDLNRRAGQNFIIHYTLRNQPGQAGFGSHGVRSLELVRLFAEEIEWTVEFLARIGLKLKGTRQRRVYVFDLAAAENFEGVPQVARDPGGKGRDKYLAVFLPSRTTLPSPEEEARYLRAAANHECTHIVCFDQGDLHGNLPDSGWVWFSEGTAEWVTLKRVRDLGGNDFQSFEFLADWVAYPQISMVEEEAWYSSVIFVEYLERLRGAHWIADLWKGATAKRDDDPWPKMQAACGEDVFLNFCCDAYFVNDPKGKLYYPELFERFGPRAWEHSYVGHTDGWVEGVVSDFGCLYFGLFPSGKNKALKIELETKDPNVCAAVLTSNKEHHEIASRKTLKASLPSVFGPADPKGNHYVLVVTTQPSSSVRPQRRRGFRFRIAGED